MAKGISTLYGQQYIEPEAPNILLNSDFYKWQRGNTVTVDDEYTADRWIARAVDQVLPSSVNVTLTKDSFVPSGVGMRNSAVLNTISCTRVGVVQRIESSELERYRGKLLQFSVYVRRIASLTNCRLQPAYGAASGLDSYTTARPSDIATLVYDADFDTHSNTTFQRISGEIVVTDTMADNGFQCGIKVLQSGETGAAIAGNILYMTGFILNESNVLTPWKSAYQNEATENVALYRYYESVWNPDAPAAYAVAFSGSTSPNPLFNVAQFKDNELPNLHRFNAVLDVYYNQMGRVR